MIDEKRERNWFWPDQNLDRVVKFTTIAVTAITFPVVLLISPASIMFARDSSGCKLKFLQHKIVGLLVDYHN
jgi:hypothetical protein